MKALSIAFVLSSVFVVSITGANEPKCPNGMVYVSGMRCPNIQERCVEWLDNPNLPYARCKHYDKSICLAEKVKMDYCIDREEMHTDDGFPLQDQSWTDCKSLCESGGKRLCNEPEWSFACGGPDMHPYSYGTGYDFDNTTCDVEHQPIMCGAETCNYVSRVDDYQACVSPFGIHNMTGSEDEWINVPLYVSSVNPGMTMRSALMSGHYFGGRHRCNVKTTDHNELFHQPTTGCRCCGDAK